MNAGPSSLPVTGTLPDGRREMTAIDVYVPARPPEPAAGQEAGAQPEREAIAAGDADPPCPCGSGKALRRCDGRKLPLGPGKAALLSCAPGVVTRMFLARVRNGQWEDMAVVGRMASLRVHKPAVDGLGSIHLDLEHGVLDIRAILERNPDLHADAELGEGLHRYEAELAATLAGMRKRAAERQVTRHAIEAGTEQAA